MSGFPVLRAACARKFAELGGFTVVGDQLQLHPDCMAWPGSRALVNVLNALELHEVRLELSFVLVWISIETDSPLHR